MTVPIWALIMPPLATLLAAFLVAWIGWRTLLQRMGSDTASLNQIRHADVRASKQNELVTHKEQWWLRVQWAIDAATAISATEERRAIGLGVLGLMATSPLADEEDRELFNRISLLYEDMDTSMDAFGNLEEDGVEREGGE